MAQREVVSFNETSKTFTAPQSGDSYHLPADVDITGNETVSGATTLNGAFAVQNNAGTTTHLAVDEATGEVTAINLAGMCGNIMAPLTHIPFKRANDEIALSGVQTFTRASTATYVDPIDGLLKTAAVDTPRFEKMSDGGVGYLTEGASTNLRTYSANTQNLTNPIYFTTVANNATAPDGTLTADTHTNNDASTRRGTWTMFGLLAATTYTYSVYARAVSGTPIVLFGSDGADLFTTSNTLSQKWQRISATFTTTLAQANNIQLYIPPLATVEVWGAQVEALPFASSYIPTTTAAVTRAADSLTIPFPGNAPRIDLSHKNGMTLVFDGDLYSGNNGALTQHFFSSSLSHEYLTRVAPDRQFVMYGGLSSIPAYAPNWIDGQANRGAFVVHPDNTAQGFLNGVGGAIGNITVDSTGTATTLYIGSWGNGAQMYGHIRNFRIYDKALTASEIAAA